MTPYPRNHDHKIRLTLESLDADALSPHFRYLAQAVWRVRTTRSAHVLCRAELPAYVTAEMDGTRATFTSPTREHLLICPSCGDVYAELLDIAILDAQGRLPPPSPLRPNLSFLETPND